MSKRKKITLIQPDSPFLFNPLTFPNLGLLDISAYLKKKNYNPDFYDLTGGVNLPENLHSDIFGFSSQITQFRSVVEMQKKLRKQNPNSLFVIGGPFPTHSPQECLKEGFDVVVNGEGEKAIIDIANNYPHIENKVHTTKDYVDLNFIPDWNTIDPLRYNAQLEEKKCVNLMTKRGNCPYKCGFCAKQESGKSPLRFKTLEYIIKELNYLKDNFGVGAIAIYDDEVFPSKKRDKAIFQALCDLGMPYRCMTRADNAAREDLEFLKKTGCAEVCIGVESADPSILKSIKKDMTIEQNTRFVKNCKDIGLKVKTYFIVGLPGESEQSVESMKKWLRESQPDNFDVSIFTPYPGSEIYNNKSNYEIDWDETKLREIWFSGKAQYEGCAVWTPHLSSKQIENYKTMIEQEFSRGQGGSTSYWKSIKN